MNNHITISQLHNIIIKKKCSSYGLGVSVFWTYLNKRMSDLMYYKAELEKAKPPNTAGFNLFKILRQNSPLFRQIWIFEQENLNEFRQYHVHSL